MIADEKKYIDDLSQDFYDLIMKVEQEATGRVLFFTALSKAIREYTYHSWMEGFPQIEWETAAIVIGEILSGEARRASTNKN